MTEQHLTIETNGGWYDVYRITANSDSRAGFHPHREMVARFLNSTDATEYLRLAS